MIGIITYCEPHRKTQDLVFQLLAHGYNDLFLMAIPMTYEKKHKPLYSHRPKLYNSVPALHLANKLSIDYKQVTSVELTRLIKYHNFERILIGGAGILPTLSQPVVNAHPGILPNVRGLDAYKWAIHEGQPIGVTSYEIGKHPDTGMLLDSYMIQPGKFNTFYEIAMEVYNTEIKLLVDSIDQRTEGRYLDDSYPLHKRMTIREEIGLLDKFNKLKK